MTKSTATDTMQQNASIFLKNICTTRRKLKHLFAIICLLSTFGLLVFARGLVCKGVWKGCTPKCLPAFVFIQTNSGVTTHGKLCKERTAGKADKEPLPHSLKMLIYIKGHTEAKDCETWKSMMGLMRNKNEIRPLMIWCCWSQQDTLSPALEGQAAGCYAWYQSVVPAFQVLESEEPIEALHVWTLCSVLILSHVTLERNGAWTLNLKHESKEA